MDNSEQQNSPANGQDQQADPSHPRSAISSDMAGIYPRPMSIRPPRQWTLDRIEATIGSIA
ncbi:hypothetical protein [Roseovarius sp. 2305UL8-3]|uniref:hypothetical protein n=1 Tax=Roseovarius conchicola TaxID=3121636 RepID=UPI003529AF7A